MGNYMLLVGVLLQGVPKFETTRCKLAPVSVDENVFRGTTVTQSEIFNYVTTAIKLWNPISLLRPKVQPGQGIVWANPNLALTLGQNGLLEVEHISKTLEMNTPTLLKAFAVHNGMLATYCIDDQYLDKQLVDRMFANISSQLVTIARPEPITQKGIYVLQLKPTNIATLQQLNWLSYGKLGEEPHLTMKLTNDLFLERISNTKSLIGNILSKAELFAKLIHWEPNPTSMRDISEFTLFVACSLRKNLEQPCSEATEDLKANKTLFLAIDNLSKARKDKSRILESTLNGISGLSKHTKLKYRSYANYAKVITSWQTHVFHDPDDRHTPHIMDTEFDYEKWSKHFVTSKTSPYRIIPQFDGGADLVIKKVASATPNKNDVDTMEQVMFLNNIHILQQFWSFLSEQRAKISQELNYIFTLVHHLDRDFEDDTSSLIEQMTGDKICTQKRKSIRCNHGPIKINGNKDEIKITSRYSLTKNATYFTPICYPYEEEGNFRNFIWDGQMFVRHKNKLTNSENQFPMTCMSQQRDTEDDDCRKYFPLQPSPRSVFLFGNIIVEPTHRKNELCFSQISHEGVMFDEAHTYVDLNSTPCLGITKFPVYLHDRQYNLDELRAIILDRLRPYEQIAKHIGKWTNGHPLKSFTSELKRTYRGVKEFFIENTHIWTITLTVLSLATVVTLIVAHWKQRLLFREETRRVIRVQEDYRILRPLMNRITGIEQFSSPRITNRDLDTEIELN